MSLINETLIRLYSENCQISFVNLKTGRRNQSI